MAPLDDNSVPTEGTFFCMGSWIFVADGSGGFKSRPIDQATPKVPEGTSNDVIDQLEEVGFSALNNKTLIQPEFGAVKTKTLSN